MCEEECPGWLKSLRASSTAMLLCAVSYAFRRNLALFGQSGRIGRLAWSRALVEQKGERNGIGIVGCCKRPVYVRVVGSSVRRGVEQQQCLRLRRWFAGLGGLLRSPAVSRAALPRRGLDSWLWLWLWLCVAAATSSERWAKVSSSTGSGEAMQSTSMCARVDLFGCGRDPVNTTRPILTLPHPVRLEQAIPGTRSKMAIQPPRPRASVTTSGCNAQCQPLNATAKRHT